MSKTAKVIGSIIVIFIVLVIIGVREEGQDTNEFVSPVVDDTLLQDQPTDGTSDFVDNGEVQKTEFIMTPEKAETIGLPEVSFSLTYEPSPQMDVTEAQPGQKNLNYTMFEYYDEDDMFVESLGFGYFNDDLEATDDIKLAVLESLIQEIVAGVTASEIVSVEKETFAGKGAYVGKFTWTQEWDTDDVISYLTQVVMYPNDNEGDNGVTFIFNAVEGNGAIETFEDFGNKGNLVDIFESFTFE